MTVQVAAANTANSLRPFLSLRTKLNTSDPKNIRSQKHQGTSDLDNLALACFYCNSYKGPNIAGYDPDTGQLFPLFNPRRDTWGEHFLWTGAVLAGLTPVGRTTIEVLCINQPDRIEHRLRLIELEMFFPHNFE